MNKNVIVKLKNIKRIIGKTIRFSAKFLLVLFVLLFVIGSLVGGYIGLKLWPTIEELKETAYEKLDSIGPNTFTYLSDTIIYANDGSIISDINTSNYKYIEIDNVSKWVQEGYIAVEDRRFKIHNGVDYKALLRAGLTLVKNKGEITQGGSTITQQVIKNNLLTQEKSFKRKIIEFFVAPEVEKRYSKQQIMEFYVNTNFYGNNCYGIETASQYYFGKAAKDLTIAESATFVGMSNNASYYNPKKNYDSVIEKRDFVLKIMKNEGVITEEEYKIAINEVPNFLYNRNAREKDNYQTSYAIHSAVLSLMKSENFEFKYTFKDKVEYDVYKENYSETYNELAEKIRGGGYEIYTSLDKNLQNELQSIIDKSTSGFTEVAEDGRYTFQGAGVLVNNQTGYVEAIVGGRGTNDEYNRGFLSKRQPGSSIKPLVVYAPSFNTGLYYPSMLMQDKEDLDDKYYPKNYGGGYRGNVSIREAVGRSINTVAYQIMKSIGSNEGLNYLSKMRFDTISYEDNNNTSVALGGFTYGVRVVDMAKGFSTLANMGDYIDNTCIKEIKYQNEGTIFKDSAERIMVYDEDSAYLMVDVLKGVLDEPYGTGARRKVKNTIAFAKTGTTNSAKDVWFCGSSAYYSLAVWCGYDTPKETNLTGGSIPGEIWNKMMTKIHMNKEELDFIKPDSVEELSITYNGEISKYETGSMDLFSQKLLDKAENKRKELEEEKKIATDNNNIENIILKLQSLRNYILKDSDDINYLNKQFALLEKDINSLYQDLKKNDLLIELESIKEYFRVDIRSVTKYQERVVLEKEILKQIELEKNIAHSLNEFNSKIVSTIFDISVIDNLYSSLKKEINKLSNSDKVLYYLNKLDEIKGYKDILLKPYREELEIQKEEERKQLYLDLENQIVILESISEYNDNLELIYSEIDTKIQLCKEKNVNLKNLENRYNIHKTYLENLKSVIEETLDDSDIKDVNSSDMNIPEGIPILN